MPNPTYSEITPKNWTDAKRIGSHLRYHVFRGQADANDWHLTSTLERVHDQYSVSPAWLPEMEQSILKQFKSRAHHYISSTPDDSNNIEWLSLIREYGGPTRLLDVTWSFYVASFFAVEDASKDACVWAINAIAPGIRAGANGYIERNDENKHLTTESLENKFAESFLNDSLKTKDFVMVITPTRFSERQAIQKGTFLFPFNLGIRFEQNLASTFDYHPNAFSEKGNQIEDLNYPDDYQDWLNIQVLKIKLPRAWHQEIIRDLYQMNIDAASLFPGLDGFARSLKFPIRIRENTKLSIEEIMKKFQ